MARAIGRTGGDGHHRRGDPGRHASPSWRSRLAGPPAEQQIQQIGYGIAAGVLMDTFFVRSMLVPSVVVLLGRWNWWPARLSQDRPAEEDAAGAPPSADAATT